ncbi:MAG: MarR family winged helix-turn-helix transcriptional regulator [Candidatus Limnocylindrales bacterium]
MPETSGHAVTFDEIEAHVQALAQVMPRGVPGWASHDLTFGQLRLLFVLRQSGPVSMGQLADMLGVTDATASEFVDRVERRGLAIRSHRADDRRVVESRLSDEGARLLAEIAGARREALRRVLSVLTGDELADFDNLLRVMAERLPAPTPPSVSTKGGPRVISGTRPASPAGNAGGGPV